MVSPNEMKQKFVPLINQEIKNQRAGLPAYIKMRVNHITDYNFYVQQEQPVKEEGKDGESKDVCGD